MLKKLFQKKKAKEVKKDKLASLKQPESAEALNMEAARNSGFLDTSSASSLLEGEAEAEDRLYEIVERVILPEKIICPDCGGITLEGLDFCDKCGGEL